MKTIKKTTNKYAKYRKNINAIVIRTITIIPNGFLFNKIMHYSL